jgi:Tfp pilus assembly protein PilZ
MNLIKNYGGTEDSAEKKMIRYTEKRGEYREFHKAPVLVQELNDIFIYSARMVNYSDNGVYIETDTALKVGTDIIIGIEDSTLISPSASTDTPKFYRVKILWQKNLIGGFFNFGYGTKFIYFNDKQNAPETNSVLTQEYRKHPRKPSSKPVFLTSKNQYYQGLISNISRGGAFIETRGKFKAGQIIRLIISGTKINEGIKLKGEILHFNQSGVGIIFKSIIKEEPKTKPSGD